jgi:hypothetical protein
MNPNIAQREQAKRGAARRGTAATLAGMSAGDGVALVVAGWGHIVSSVREFDGQVLTLASGRSIPVGEILAADDTDGLW